MIPSKQEKLNLDSQETNIQKIQATFTRINTLIKQHGTQKVFDGKFLDTREFTSGETKFTYRKFKKGKKYHLLVSVGSLASAIKSARTHQGMNRHTQIVFSLENGNTKITRHQDTRNGTTFSSGSEHTSLSSENNEDNFKRLKKIEKSLQEKISEQKRNTVPTVSSIISSLEKYSMQKVKEANEHKLHILQKNYRKVPELFDKDNNDKRILKKNFEGLLPEWLLERVNDKATSSATYISFYGIKINPISGNLELEGCFDYLANHLPEAPQIMTVDLQNSPEDILKYLPKNTKHTAFLESLPQN